MRTVEITQTAVGFLVFLHSLVLFTRLGEV